MGKPDALSRRADHGSGVADNADITLLGPELFQVHALEGVTIVGEECSILRDVRKALADGELDESVAKAAKELKQDKSRGLVRSAEWLETDGLLLFRGKIYVPNDRDLRRRIVKQHHDSRIAGHPGRWKTLELVSRSYWWPQMSRYIGLYTKMCDLCCRTKVQRHKPFGELHPTATLAARWDTISVDFIVELLEAHGYDVIMVVVDSLSKQAHFIPTTSNVTTEGTANLFLHEVWKHHGLPNSVLLDRGTQFTSVFIKSLYKALGIRMSTSTAHHPQLDGQTECANQELEQYLRSYVNERQDNWDTLLPFAEFAHNSQTHSSTQQVPFMTDSGRLPRMGFEPGQPGADPQPADECATRMSVEAEEAKAALTKAKEEYAQYYN